MARGLPDDYDVTSEFPTYQVPDLAEVAARLGSYITYDRSGRQLWADSFEGSTLRWPIATFGSGSSVSLTSNSARSGYNAVMLTAGAVSGAYAGILRRFPTLGISRYGFTAWISLFSTINRFECWMIYYTGSKEIRSAVRYELSTQRISILTSGEYWNVVLASIPLQVDYSCFNYVKLIVDFLSKRYVQLFFNSYMTELSPFAPSELSNTTPASLRLAVYCYGVGTSSSAIYVDDVVLTIEE